jgi:hypothetical protein
MTRSFILTLTLLLPAVAFCGKARLYSLDSGDVIEVKFGNFWGTGHGKTIARLKNGAVLKGEFSTVPRGATSWGSVYTSLYGTSTSFKSTMMDEQRGSGILAGDGHVIDCEYVVSGVTGHGSGACRDNEGKLYKLLF